MLALIFNSMLVHGFSPDSILVGTMVPIPKDKRQLVCTILELLLLAALLPNCLMLLHYLNADATSHLQFEFKQICPYSLHILCYDGDNQLL